MSKSIANNTQKIILRDFAVCLFLVILFFALAYGSLTNICFWGDDFAAYILQGISIAEGNFDEQVKLNHFMHPSYMPAEATDGELVYVWGYSLAHALVYKLVGFDRDNFSSIIYYKLPSVVALALMAGILYLFLRRRFSCRLSIFMSVLFCLYSGFFDFFNEMYSDLFFLFFAVLSMYLCELFIDASGMRRIVLGVFFGITLWYMYEVRLNGVSIIFLCALAQVMPYFNRNRRHKCSADKNSVISGFLPYVIFIVLKFISEAILAPATSNASDLQSANLGIIFGNMVHYFDMLLTWYGSIWSNILHGIFCLGVFPTTDNPAFYNVIFHIQKLLSYSSIALCFIGILFDGIKKNFHYTIFMGFYYFVSCMLFYNQGLRYLFPILPVILMFTGYGAVRVFGFLSKKNTFSRGRKNISVILLIAICFLALYPQYLNNQRIQSLEGQDSFFPSVAESSARNAYSSSAVEAYNYINENIDKDSIIGFFKPRALYLNTQIKSIVPLDIIGHSLEEVSHYLVFKHIIINPPPTDDFITVWENEDFVLMEKIK